MSAAFFDTNVLVYAFGTDPRAERAAELMQAGGWIGVQSLNELANVLRRKQRFTWDEVDLAIASVRRACPPPVVCDALVQMQGFRLARRYGFSIYDAMIVAAALAAGCDTLWSEDMHDGLVVDGLLTIRNPFA